MGIAAPGRDLCRIYSPGHPRVRARPQACARAAVSCLSCRGIWHEIDSPFPIVAGQLFSNSLMVHESWVVISADTKARNRSRHFLKPGVAGPIPAEGTTRIYA